MSVILFTLLMGKYIVIKHYLINPIESRAEKTIRESLNLRTIIKKVIAKHMW